MKLIVSFSQRGVKTINKVKNRYRFQKIHGSGMCRLLCADFYCTQFQSTTAINEKNVYRCWKFDILTSYLPISTAETNIEISGKFMENYRRWKFDVVTSFSHVSIEDWCAYCNKVKDIDGCSFLDVQSSCLPASCCINTVWCFWDQCKERRQFVGVLLRASISIVNFMRCILRSL